MKMIFIAIAATVIATLPVTAHAQDAVELKTGRLPVTVQRARSAPSWEAPSVPQPEQSRPSWAWKIAPVFASTSRVSGDLPRDTM